MKEFKIYTGGKMGGTTYEEQMGWRLELEETVKKLYDGLNVVNFLHPPLYYNYVDHVQKTDKEILDWEMMQLHNSDILVINLDQVDSTTGTHMELGAVEGINRFGDKYIFVIGIGKDDNLHPWIKSACNRIEGSITDAAMYIAEYLLV